MNKQNIQISGCDVNSEIKHHEALVREKRKTKIFFFLVKTKH